MWLDRDTSDDPTTAIESLHRRIDRVERFTDLATCEVAVQHHGKPIILVVSGQMGRELIPRIHHLPQLVTVFVYCMDKQRNKEWSNPSENLSNFLSCSTGDQERILQGTALFS